MVTHGNIIANCDAVIDHCPVGVSWLPQYHDMGLIGYYLFIALKGGTTYGFSPAAFIEKPVLWLETLSTSMSRGDGIVSSGRDTLLEEAVFAVVRGGVTLSVMTAGGQVMGQVVQVRPAGVPPLAEVRGPVVDAIKME